MKLKEALKEEAKASLEKVKAIAKEAALELLESIAIEGLDMLERSVTKSEGKSDDLYLLVGGKLKAIADKINPADNE